MVEVNYSEDHYGTFLNSELMHDHQIFIPNRNDEFFFWH